MTVETSQTPSAAIDSDRWPAVAKVPRGPLAAASAAIANRLLRRTATHLPLRLVYLTERQQVPPIRAHPACSSIGRTHLHAGSGATA